MMKAKLVLVFSLFAPGVVSFDDPHDTDGLCAERTTLVSGRRGTAGAMFIAPEVDSRQVSLTYQPCFRVDVARIVDS